MSSLSILCFDRYRVFIAAFLLMAFTGLGLLEFALREFVHEASDNGLLAKRVAAIYEERTWPILGDSRLGNVLVGDSQIYTGFAGHHAGFFQLSLSAETAPMLEILVKEYFRFRQAGRVIIEAGPQLFAQPQFDNGTRKHETYFQQHNWLQHHTGLLLYLAEPGISSFIREWSANFPVSIATHAATPVPNASASPIERANWSEYPDEERRRLARRRATKQRPVVGFETSTHAAAFERMLSSLAERHASLCLMRMPVTAEYLEAIEGDLQYITATEYFQKLAVRYRARYLDFRGMSITLRPIHFMNQDHLDMDGAALFAPRAIEDCFLPRG